MSTTQIEKEEDDELIEQVIVDEETEDDIEYIEEVEVDDDDDDDDEDEEHDDIISNKFEKKQQQSHSATTTTSSVEMTPRNDDSVTIEMKTPLPLSPLSMRSPGSKAESIYKDRMVAALVEQFSPRTVAKIKAKAEGKATPTKDIVPKLVHDFNEITSPKSQKRVLDGAKGRKKTSKRSSSAKAMPQVPPSPIQEGQEADTTAGFFSTREDMQDEGVKVESILTDDEADELISDVINYDGDSSSKKKSNSTINNDDDNDILQGTLNDIAPPLASGNDKEPITRQTSCDTTEYSDDAIAKQTSLHRDTLHTNATAESGTKKSLDTTTQDGSASSVKKQKLETTKETKQDGNDAESVELSLDKSMSDVSSLGDDQEPMNATIARRSSIYTEVTVEEDEASIFYEEVSITDEDASVSLADSSVELKEDGKGVSSHSLNWKQSTHSNYNGWESSESLLITSNSWQNSAHANSFNNSSSNVSFASARESDGFEGHESFGKDAAPPSDDLQEPEIEDNNERLRTKRPDRSVSPHAPTKIPSDHGPVPPGQINPRHVLDGGRQGGRGGPPPDRGGRGPPGRARSQQRMRPQQQQPMHGGMPARSQSFSLGHRPPPQNRGPMDGRMQTPRNMSSARLNSHSGHRPINNNNNNDPRRGVRRAKSQSHSFDSRSSHSKQLMSQSQSDLHWDNSSIADFSVPDFSPSVVSGFTDIHSKDTDSHVLAGQQDSAEDKTDDVKPIFGRGSELRTLEASLFRIADPKLNNTKEIVWLYGPPGVGKSATVTHFANKGKRRKTAFVCHAVFEENYIAAMDFSGVVECMNQLVTQLSKDFEAALWVERLKKSLGSHVVVLSPVIPALRELLGLEDNADMSFTFDMTTRRRFDRLRFAMRTLVETICNYRPVVIILDDLQWARRDSLRLIQTFLGSAKVKNLLFVGCHRAIKTKHPLAVMKSDLSDEISTTLLLENLAPENVMDILVQYLSEKYHDEVPPKDEQLMALSDALFRKTGGNALMIVHLIRYLEDKDMIVNLGDNEWQWDAEQILLDTKIPDSPFDLMAARVQSLSKKAKLALASAAYFDLEYFETELVYEIVAEVFEQDHGEGEKCLIADTKALERLFEIASEEGVTEKIGPGHYKFAHDSIRQSAQTLLPGGKKLKVFRFHVGNRLKKVAMSYDKERREDREKVRLLALDQLNCAIEIVNRDRDRVRLARMNLDIAMMSISKCSFESAIVSLETALSYMDPKIRWKEDNYELSLRIYQTLARMKFCCGSYDEAKVFIDEVRKHAASSRDKVGATQVQIYILMVNEDYEKAFGRTVSFLSVLGMNLPRKGATKELSKELVLLQQKLETKKDSEILSLPLLTDHRVLCKMRFLGIMTDICTSLQDNVYLELAAIKMIRLTLQHGIAFTSSLAFALHGACAARRKRYNEAYRYGKIAQMMAKTYSVYDGQAVAHFYWTISHWRRPYRTSLDHLVHLADKSMDSGNIESFALIAGTYAANWLVSGSNLRILEKKMKEYQEIIMDFSVSDTWLFGIPHQALLELMGRIDTYTFDLYQEQTKLAIKWEENGNAKAMQYIYLMQLVTAVFFNQMDVAEEVQMKLRHKPEGVWYQYRAFLEGIIAFAMSQTQDDSLYEKYYKKGCVFVGQVEKWVADGAVNCAHMLKLLKAEEMISSQEYMGELPVGKVRKAYDVAIAAATKDGFIHHRALASERAGLYFLFTGFNTEASIYLSMAHEAYQRWGAFAKVDQLSNEYGELIIANSPPPQLPPQQQQNQPGPPGRRMLSRHMSVNQIKQQQQQAPMQRQMSLSAIPARMERQLSLSALQSQSKLSSAKDAFRTSSHGSSFHNSFNDGSIDIVEEEEAEEVEEEEEEEEVDDDDETEDGVADDDAPEDSLRDGDDDEEEEEEAEETERGEVEDDGGGEDNNDDTMHDDDNDKVNNLIDGMLEPESSEGAQDNTVELSEKSKQDPVGEKLNSPPTSGVKKKKKRPKNKPNNGGESSATTASKPIKKKAKARPPTPGETKPPIKKKKKKRPQAAGAPTSSDGKVVATSPKPKKKSNNDSYDNVKNNSANNLQEDNESNNNNNNKSESALSTIAPRPKMGRFLSGNWSKKTGSKISKLFGSDSKLSGGDGGESSDQDNNMNSPRRDGSALSPGNSDSVTSFSFDPNDDGNGTPLSPRKKYKKKKSPSLSPKKSVTATPDIAAPPVSDKGTPGRPPRKTPPKHPKTATTNNNSKNNDNTTDSDQAADQQQPMKKSSSARSLLAAVGKMGSGRSLFKKGNKKDNGSKELTPEDTTTTTDDNTTSKPGPSRGVPKQRSWVLSKRVLGGGKKSKSSRNLSSNDNDNDDVVGHDDNDGEDTGGGGGGGGNEKQNFMKRFLKK